VYICQQPVGLLVVGLIASLLGIVLLANVGGVSERTAGLFGRYGFMGRFADRPDAWRVLGAITLGWAIPLSIWAASSWR
jgi:hypothetical protein